LFVAPTILEEEMRTRHGVVAGRDAGSRRRIVERRLAHPCVARDGIFKGNATR
jgi:transposase